MTEHLPEWVMIRYAKLWIKLKDKEFTKERAEKILKDNGAIAVFLSDLRKAGWMEIRIDEEDARRTIYKLKKPETVIIEEIKEMSKK